MEWLIEFKYFCGGGSFHDPNIPIEGTRIDASTEEEALEKFYIIFQRELRLGTFKIITIEAKEDN